METARPWDRSPTHEDIEFAPLYPLNHSYSLSEMNVDPKYYHLFGEGHVLATMHHDGFLNLDLHPEHVFFEPATGIVRTIDARMHKTFLEPKAMALDFVTPFATFPPAAFHSILTGYTQSAWVQLEPLYPGYVREMIGQIGGNVTVLPEPRSNVLNLHEILNELGLSLERGAPGLLLRQVGNQSLRLSNHDPKLILAVCVPLMLAGLDPVAGIQPFQTVEGLRPVLTILTTLSQMASHAPLEREMAGAGVLSALLQLVGDGAIGIDFIDPIIDGLDSLAEFCDGLSEEDPSQVIQSLRFAQMAAMLLGKSCHDAKRDEARYLTLVARHAGLGWFDPFLSLLKEPSIAMAELVYANTRAAIFFDGYQKSSDTEQGIRLWSLLWRTLTLTRQSLASIHRHLSAHRVHEAMSKLTLVLLHRLARCLLKIITPADFAAIEAGQHHSHSKWMIEEFEWTRNLHEQIQSTTIESPEVLKLFSKGIESQYFRSEDLFYPIYRLWR